MRKKLHIRRKGSSTGQGLRYKKIRKRVAVSRERLYDKVVSKWHNGCMSTSRSRTSRVFTISFPEDLAEQVEQVAKQESRNVSELFREAFRAYRFERIRRRLSTARKTAALSAPKGRAADDIERLVDEIRSELSRTGQA